VDDHPNKVVVLFVHLELIPSMYLRDPIGEGCFGYFSLASRLEHALHLLPVHQLPRALHGPPLYHSRRAGPVPFWKESSKILVILPNLSTIWKYRARLTPSPPGTSLKSA
jgi:hypothetical protein